MSDVNPYCTAADVKAKLPRILRGSDSPKSIITNADIDNECLKISAEMDVRFKAIGINVPVNVDSSERVKRNLNRIAVNGTAASILKSNVNEDDRNYDLAEMYERQYYSDIQRIEQNGLGLEDEDTPASAITVGKSSYPSAFTPAVDNPTLPSQWGRW